MQRSIRQVIEWACEAPRLRLEPLRARNLAGLRDGCGTLETNSGGKWQLDAGDGSPLEDSGSFIG